MPLGDIFIEREGMIKPNSVRQIEDWFASSGDDGEFVRYDRGVPYFLIGPTHVDGFFIYFTKPTIASNIFSGHIIPEGLGVLGRYGLPDERDMYWIRTLIGSSQLLFLGDMDPVDLMIFAWLRQYLLKQVIYVGISDAFLSQIKLSSHDYLIMTQSPSEIKCISTLNKVLYDLDATVGSQCAGILNRGCKIELDAVVNAECIDKDALVFAVTKAIDFHR